MPRSGMANIIRRVRGMVQAGTADYSLAGVTWWSDDQIQEVLDTCRTDYQFADLQTDPELIGGTLIYKNYYLPDSNWEETNSGSAYWLVTNAIGNDAGTANYTVNYLKGVIRFNSNQSGSAFYLTGKTYSLYAAAADIWRQKAGGVWDAINFSSDNQSFSRAGRFDHCMSMAAHYDSLVGFSVGRFTRDDLVGGNDTPDASLRLSDGGIPAGDDY